MVDWENVGFIKGSKYRLMILNELLTGVKTPSELSAAIGIRTNHISRTLRELEERGIVECKTPTLRKGRLYSMTSYGKDLLKELNR